MPPAPEPKICESCEMAIERGEYKHHSNREVCVNRLETMLEECRQKLAEAERERDLAVADNAALLAAMKPYIECHGPCHESECPCDDTCDCRFKSVNDAVNAAFAQPHPGVALLAEVDGLRKRDAQWLEKWKAAVDSRDKPMEEIRRLRESEARLREALELAIKRLHWAFPDHVEKPGTLKCWACVLREKLEAALAAVPEPKPCAHNYQPMPSPVRCVRCGEPQAPAKEGGAK